MQACRAELTYAEEDISSPSTDFWVLYDQEKTGGFYALSLAECNAELEALFVKPELIGQQLGTLLMAHAIANAKERGLQKLTVQGDPHADRFYRRCGGVRRGERVSGSITGRMLPLYEFRLTSQSRSTEEKNE